MKPALSLKSRLIRAQLLGTGLVLIACSLSFTFNDLYNFKRSVEQTLESNSSILERSLVAALAFSDRAEAAKSLSSLEAEPSVVAASVFAVDGTLFEKYGSPNSGVIQPNQ